MDEDKNDPGSAQEQEFLKFAAFAGELHQRLFPEQKTQNKQKPWWQVFLESTGGAALITVLVGGLIAGAVGQWISNGYQRSMKERETSLAVYKEYLGQGKETVTQAYELIGNTIAATEDFMDITGSRYYQGKYDIDNPAEKKRVVDQAQEITGKFTNAKSNWRKESERLGLFISFHHDARPEVMTSWRQMQDSVALYMTCAHVYFLTAAISMGGDVDPEDRCEDEKKSVHDSLDKFTEARLKAAQQRGQGL